MLHSLRAILDVTKSKSLLFDDANSIVYTEDVVSDVNITLSIVVGIWQAAVDIVWEILYTLVAKSYNIQSSQGPRSLYAIEMKMKIN